MGVLRVEARMAKYVGLDWAGRGWFAVILEEDDGWETALFPTIWSCWKYHSDADRILVDVPIGLPTDARRACDVEAKAKLGRRGRSVFYAPVREAVYEDTLADAKATNEAAADFSVQNQAWSIVPRIREVDEFLDVYPGARDRLVETHPELCFYALNGRTPVPEPKTTAGGVERRTALLADEHPAAAPIIKEAGQRYTSPRYAPSVRGVDDVIDALVAAITARRMPEATLTVPDAPPTDARGLPIRIVYPADTEQTRLSTLGESTE
jgi:predicted RNase H-like nuclease